MSFETASNSDISSALSEIICAFSQLLQGTGHAELAGILTPIDAKASFRRSPAINKAAFSEAAPSYVLDQLQQLAGVLKERDHPLAPQFLETVERYRTAATQSPAPE